MTKIRKCIKDASIECAGLVEVESFDTWEYWCSAPDPTRSHHECRHIETIYKDSKTKDPMSFDIDAPWWCIYRKEKREEQLENLFCNSCSFFATVSVLTVRGVEQGHVHFVCNRRPGPILQNVHPETKAFIPAWCPCYFDKKTTAVKSVKEKMEEEYWRL